MSYCHSNLTPDNISVQHTVIGTDRQIQIGDHGRVWMATLGSQLVALVGRLWNSQEVGSCWRKWVTASWTYGLPPTWLLVFCSAQILARSHGYRAFSITMGMSPLKQWNKNTFFPYTQHTPGQPVLHKTLKSLTTREWIVIGEYLNRFSPHSLKDLYT